MSEKSTWNETWQMSHHVTCTALGRKTKPPKEMETYLWFGIDKMYLICSLPLRNMFTQIWRSRPRKTSQNWMVIMWSVWVFVCHPMQIKQYHLEIPMEVILGCASRYGAHNVHITQINTCSYSKWNCINDDSRGTPKIEHDFVETRCLYSNPKTIGWWGISMGFIR